MTSGGARARSGPDRDTTALRRQRDNKEWLRLSPNDGLTGEDVPPWPAHFPHSEEDQLLFSKAEGEMWRHLWAKPQALIWKADGVEDLVAAYVRIYLEAMEPGGAVGNRTLARQYAEALLLTPATLNSAKILIDANLKSSKTGLSDTANDDQDVATAADVAAGRNVIPFRPPDASDDWDGGAGGDPDD